MNNHKFTYVTYAELREQLNKFINNLNYDELVIFMKVINQQYNTEIITEEQIKKIWGE